MRNNSLALILMALGVAACGTPQTLYARYQAGLPETTVYKQGGTYPQIKNIITNCKIEAAQRVPQQLTSYTTPAYQMPSSTQCNQIGTQVFCNTMGGGSGGGDTYTEDSNEGLRQQAYAQCLDNNGYRIVAVPACPPGIDIDQMYASANGGLPPLNQSTCYVATPNDLISIGNTTPF